MSESNVEWVSATLGSSHPNTRGLVVHAVPDMEHLQKNEYSNVAAFCGKIPEAAGWAMYKEKIVTCPTCIREVLVKSKLK
jgi:hypothetical protein